MERIRALWNRGLVGKVIISLVGLVIICCVIGILVPRTPRRQQGTAPTSAPAVGAATSAPQPTEAPAATEGPTNTPAPTDTPEPTAIPALTNAPEPTSAPAISVAVRTYMAQMGSEVGKIGDSLRELGTLLTNAKPTDTNWKIDLAVQVVTIQQSHKTLTEMQVPDEMTDIHAAVLNATSDCDTSMRFLTSGIDDNNVNDVRQAATYMGQCSEKITAANRQVSEYVDAHQ